MSIRQLERSPTTFVKSGKSTAEKKASFKKTHPFEDFFLKNKGGSFYVMDFFSKKVKKISSLRGKWVGIFLANSSDTLINKT